MKLESKSVDKIDFEKINKGFDSLIEKMKDVQKSVVSLGVAMSNIKIDLDEYELTEDDKKWIDNRPIKQEVYEE